MTLRRFAPQQIIFREGEQGTSFYRITGGTVGIFVHYGTDGQQELTRLSAGQLFGEIAAVMAVPRTATAEALDEVEAEEVAQDELMGFFSRYPENLVDLMQALTARIRAMTEALREAEEAAREKRSLREKDSLFAFLRRRRPGKEAKPDDTWKASGEAIRMWRESTSDSRIRTDSYEKGGVIFRSGEKGDCMYEIEQGAVGIYTDYGKPDEMLLRTLHPGEIFGEMGLIDREARSADAVAAADGTRLLLVRDSELPLLFLQRQDTVERLLKQLADRLSNLTDRYNEVCKSL